MKKFWAMIACLLALTVHGAANAAPTDAELTEAFGMLADSLRSRQDYAQVYSSFHTVAPEAQDDIIPIEKVKGWENRVRLLKQAFDRLNEAQKLKFLEYYFAMWASPYLGKLNTFLEEQGKKPYRTSANYVEFSRKFVIFKAFPWDTEGFNIIQYMKEFLAIKRAYMKIVVPVKLAAASAASSSGASSSASASGASGSKPRR